MSVLINHIRPDLSPTIIDRQINGNKLEKSIEKISSGLRINKASDGPADLYISEKIRSQTASIDQAIQNTEVDISMMQLADSSLNEVYSLLVNMRQLAVQAANEASQDDASLTAIQQEYQRASEAIDEIVRNTKFGGKNLIDGSGGNSGFTSGQNLEFIKASEKTKLMEGTEEDTSIVINQNATQSVWVSEDVLDEDIAAEGVTLKIFENGRTAIYKTKEGDNPYSIAQSLQYEIERAGLDLRIDIDNEKLVVLHNKYGSDHTFQVYSDYEGVFSSSEEEPNEAVRGYDVEAYVGAIKMIGKGQIMEGPKGTSLEGLVMRYSGTEGGIEGESGERTAGKLYFNYGALRFQTGAEAGATQGISINGYNTDTLGRGIVNSNNFGNLNEINLTKKKGGRDAMLLLDDSLTNLNVLRTEIGAVQKHGLESKLNTLLVTRENLSAAQSVIRDTDYAEEISKMLRYNIIQNNQTALTAQMNKKLYNLESLLMN